MGYRRRLVFDISLIARWRGPPVGILRREQALARHALASRPDMAFCVMDRALAAWRWVRRHRVEMLIRWDTKLDKTIADTGTFEESDPPGPGDTILAVGNHAATDGDVVAALKQRHGFRYVTMCHDLIPLRRPEFFEERTVRSFRRYWHAVLPLAELVLVNSRAVMRDVDAYGRAQGLRHGRIARVRPGCDLSGEAPAPSLPGALRPGRFALFVATIEPRKGHAMILDIWQRLVQKGLPQQRGFSLAIVGRPGWLADELLRRLREPAAFAGTVIYLTGVDDALLARLYRDCAFGLLPSLDEGFGMPLIESFACGRSAIASTAGSLPEVAGRFAPCLPAGAHAVWQAMLERWIADEKARAPYEAAIRESFRPVTWDQAAAETFAVAAEA